MRTTPAQHATAQSKDTKWGIPWRTVWEEVASGARNMGNMNRMEEQEKRLRRIRTIANKILV